MVRFASNGANSISVGGDILTKQYKFWKNSWTPVVEADLDYLLSPYSPYSLMTEHSVGKWLLRYTGEKPLRLPKRSIKPGQAFKAEREEAISLLKRRDVEYDTVGLLDAESILITRFGGFGDVLLSLPSVVELMKKNSSAYIAYATSKANLPIIEHCGLKLDAFTIEDVYSAGADFDAVVELSRWVEAADDSSRVHRSDIFARRFGVKLHSYTMPYNVTEQEREWATNLLHGLSRPLVVMQAAGSIGRRTPPAHTLMEVADGLIELGCSVVAIDHRHFPEFYVDLNLTGCTTTTEMMAVIEQADVVVCGDSGVLHAANALSRPCVAVCGSVHPDLRVRGQDNCRTLLGAFWSNCGPCDDKAPCEHPENCLAAVPASAIIEAVQTWL